VSLSTASIIAEKQDVPEVDPILAVSPESPFSPQSSPMADERSSKNTTFGGTASKVERNSSPADEEPALATANRPVAANKAESFALNPNPNLLKIDII
jgi:hypothetical protein